MIRAALFDAKPYDIEVFTRLAPPEVEVTGFPLRLEEKTAALAQGFDVVIAFVNDDLNAKVLDRLCAQGVKLIALRCAGFNNVDVQAAYERIHIVRVPAYSPEAVAEHTAALLLASVRRIHKAYNRTRDFNFSLNGLVGMNLAGKRVGVVGTGKIGKAFIRICRGIGMEVLAYDKFPDPKLDVEYVDLPELYHRSDVISLHCPLTEDNLHMIDSRAIGQMKPGVVLLNTSRGALVDAEALLTGIKERRIGAACLDVYEEESDLFFEDRSGHILGDDVLARLLTMPNVILTSHQAFLTTEALEAIAQTTLDNITAFFTRNTVQNEVCYHCGAGEMCRKQRRERCF